MPSPDLLIAGERVQGEGGGLRGWNPATDTALEPEFRGASAAQLDRACALADEAFDTFRETPLAARAAFLERVAERILELGDSLIERTMAESGLPRGRVEGERGRTIGQLRMFAEVVREGGWLEARVDPAQPDRQPLPRVDLRQRHVAIGPVAVFGASNFPLAFSVAGGDTASALAAGCPVVAKAHSAHPGTSALVGSAVQAAAADTGMPHGVFSLLFDSGREIGQGLVADRRIKGAGFTGSRGGGMALVRIGQNRPEPIPVYAEMSSINPVLLMPGALAERGEAIATAYVGSLTLGAGQFCTNPGLVLAVEGPPLDAFLRAAAETLSGTPAAVMLTRGIRQAYESGVETLAGHAAVETIGRGGEGGATHGRSALFATTVKDFRRHPELAEEVFGAASLVVRCRDLQGLRDALEVLEGQLTIAVHMADGDVPDVRALMPTLERKAGRILVNGFGTGVEVGHAMVHGGPFPATSDGRSTSVGSLAIRRWLRPVCYQDMPEALLPGALRDANPLRIDRRVDGRPSSP